MPEGTSEDGIVYNLFCSPLILKNVQTASIRYLLTLPSFKTRSMDNRNTNKRVLNGFFEEEEKEEGLSSFLSNAPPRKVAISTRSIRFPVLDQSAREKIFRRTTV